MFSVFGRLSFAKIDAAGLIAADPNVIAALAKAGTQLIATRVEAERDVVEMNDLGIGFGQGDLLGKVRPAKSDGEQLRRAA